MSIPPYHDPYRVNPQPVNTTTGLNQPQTIGTNETTYTTGVYTQPTTTLTETGHFVPQQTTTEKHGILHRKKKTGEGSSSSSSSSQEKKRKKMDPNGQQKPGFIEKMKMKAQNLMHKSQKTGETK